MKLVTLALMLFMWWTTSGLAQVCPLADAGDLDALAKFLSEAKSCREAVTTMNACAWGSSADTQIAPIAIQRCEKTLLPKLTKHGMDRYAEEMQLCAYEYARQPGTMYMSAAALCQVDVAGRFAAHPEQAEKPAPRASFNCAKARSLLEKTICSHRALGKADIVLSRVYVQALKNLKPGQRDNLIRSQKVWLQQVPGQCGLRAHAKVRGTIDCIRNAFERRFTDLEDCGEDTDECSQQMDADEDLSPIAERENSARASFDCEEPSTGLELVICADSRLGAIDIQLAEAYRAAKEVIPAEQRQELVSSETRWLKFVNRTCPLGVVGGIPPIAARGCVKDAFETRIGQLRACPKLENARQRQECLDDFHFSIERENSSSPPE